MIAENISTLAAAASALAGIYAAVAAARSAGSARVAQEAAAESERRVAVRLLSVASADVQVEYQRAQACASDLLSGYQNLEARSGSFQNSGIAERVTKVRERINGVGADVEHAVSFRHGALVLQQSPISDVEREHIRVATTLTQVRALREELDRERAVLEARLLASA